MLSALAGCATEGPRNEAVADYREPEIVCKMEAPTGSRIKKRVCHEHGGPTGLERDRTFGRLHDLPMDRNEVD
jgi:hypothetical protein